MNAVGGSERVLHAKRPEKSDQTGGKRAGADLCPRGSTPPVFPCRQARRRWVERLVTFALTAFADLTIAVELGLVLAALLFIRRVADTTTVELVTGDYVEEGRAHILQDKDIPGYVAVYRIHGPFLFGTTDKLQAVLDAIPTLPPIIVLRLRNMTALDATGLRAVEDLGKRFADSGWQLLVCGARRQPAELLARAGFARLVGPAHVLPDVNAALTRARELYASRMVDVRAAG